MEDKRQKKASTLPWIEKYRPKKLNDVAHQTEVVEVLRRTIQSVNLPHFLFYGPPGTGKTSTILAVARELYGPELIKKRVLELNASDERGINVIRTKVKTFAQQAVSSKDKSSGYPCPPYKIIILDEADSMTQDAQSALRRTMENYTKVTRFCIICNYVSRIIEPISSRCAKFRFKPLPFEPMKVRLQTIATAEQFKVTDEAIEALILLSEGDMRKSITVMQSAKRLTIKDGILSKNHVDEIAGLIPTPVVMGIMGACKANSFQHVHDAAQNLVSAGYPTDAILHQLLPIVIQDSEISESSKAKICIRMAEADKKIIDQADEYLQLLDVMSFIARTIVAH